jgi:glycosyltransferase involved in cell wall biosynthesis
MSLTSSEPRTVFVLDSLAVGGTEHSTVAIATGVANSVIVTLFDASPNLVAEAEAKGIRVVPLGLPKVTSMFQAANALRRELIRLNPQIVHSALFRADVAARIASVGARWKLVTSLVNDSYSDVRFSSLRSSERLKLRMVQAIDVATIGVCREIVANSHAIAATNADALALRPSSVRVIPRGRDLEVFRPPLPGEKEACRRDLQLPMECDVVMNVGRLIARKGHSCLLKAFATMSEYTVLVIVGDGPERFHLEQDSRGLGIAPRVRFLGSRKDVAELLRCADVFAFPSQYEGFPGALVEALATGLPVVASDIPMHREAISNGADGLLFAVDSPAALAACLVEALDPDRSRRLSKSARSNAEARYSLQVMTDAHAALYRSLVSP